MTRNYIEIEGSPITAAELAAEEARLLRVWDARMKRDREREVDAEEATLP